MTHPEELLAGYVDGTLSTEERASVDAHLSGCARCRGEEAAAARARTALAMLPDLPAPLGVASRALEEAGALRRAKRDSGNARWYRLVGATAAAAAAVVVLAVVLPSIGRTPSPGPTADRRIEAASGSALDASGQAAGAPVLEIQPVDYDQGSITALTASYQRSPSASTEFSTATRTGSPQKLSAALSCLAKATPGETGSLTRLIRARFEGTPAYVAVFLETPGAGEPPDSVAVWVISSQSCSILSSGFARL